jgi:hypothetical protein
LVADEVQGLAGGGVELGRRHDVPGEHPAEVVQRRHEVLHGLDGVRLEIAVPDDALVRVEIDRQASP